MNDPVEFKADYSDQSGWFDPDSFAETLTVIGLGGIGASALPTLVTMGFRKFVLWDDDVVEPRNVASQLLYRPSDLYRGKAETCREYLLAYGATEVEIVESRFTPNCEINTGVVISGVDTMAARQDIWKGVRDSSAQLYLDGRIGGLHMSLFTVEPFDGEWYETKWLFDDKNAAPLPCTQRAIAYPAVALGSWMGANLVNWHRGDAVPKRVEQNMGNHFFLAVGEVGK